jgi:hypothetical protein
MLDGFANLLFPQGGAPAPQAAMPGDAPPVAPVAQAPAAPPPAPAPAPAFSGTPQQEAIANSETKGEGFFAKLKNDPALAQAVMMMGSRLMQGPKPGQNEIGALGDAAMVGAMTHYGIKTNEREMQDKEARSAALIARENAGTKGLEQQTTQNGEMFEDRKNKLAEEVKRLRSQGKYEEARAKIEEFKSNPENLQKTYELENSVLSTRADANRGSAAAGFASGRASDARAGLYQEQTTNPDKFKSGGGSGANGLGTVGKGLRDWTTHYEGLGYSKAEATVMAEKAVKKEKSRNDEADFDKWTKDNFIDVSTEAELKKARALFQKKRESFGTTEEAAAASGKGGAAAPAPATAERVHGKTYMINGQERRWFNDGKNKGWE